MLITIEVCLFTSRIVLRSKPQLHRPLQIQHHEVLVYIDFYIFFLISFRAVETDLYVALWFAEKGISFAAANSKWFKAIFQHVDAHPPSPAKIQEHVRIAEVILCLSTQHITNHP